MTSLIDNLTPSDDTTPEEVRPLDRPVNDSEIIGSRLGRIDPNNFGNQDDPQDSLPDSDDDEDTDPVDEPTDDDGDPTGVHNHTQDDNYALGGHVTRSGSV